MISNTIVKMAEESLKSRNERINDLDNQPEEPKEEATSNEDLHNHFSQSDIKEESTDSEIILSKDLQEHSLL